MKKDGTRWAWLKGTPVPIRIFPLLLGLKQTAHEELNTLCHDIVEEKRMKSYYENSRANRAMKATIAPRTCGACGQPKPAPALLVGTMLQHRSTRNLAILTENVPSGEMSLRGVRVGKVFPGCVTVWHRNYVDIIHGYYHITDRKPA